MKKKIKDLTLRECQKMCKKREHKCEGCPLFLACCCVQFNLLNDIAEKEIEVEE